MKFLKSILSSPQTSSVLRGGYAVVKNQPAFAPVLAGGSIATALGMILIGGYGVFDCIRFQTRYGQCKESIERDGGMFGAGVVMLLGNWGSFNTYNKKLHVDDTAIAPVAPRGLVEDHPVAPTPDTLSSARPEPTREEVVNYMMSGATQEETARFFEITRYKLRKILGSKENRKHDRGR